MGSGGKGEANHALVRLIFWHPLSESEKFLVYPVHAKPGTVDEPDRLEHRRQKRIPSSGGMPEHVCWRDTTDEPARTGDDQPVTVEFDLYRLSKKVIPMYERIKHSLPGRPPGHIRNGELTKTSSFHGHDVHVGVEDTFEGIENSKKGALQIVPNVVLGRALESEKDDFVLGDPSSHRGQATNQEHCRECHLTVPDQLKVPEHFIRGDSQEPAASTFRFDGALKEPDLLRV